MARKTPALVIDARPRGPDGPLAGEVVLGRPVLVHLLDLAASLALDERPVAIHARLDEHGQFRALIGDRPGSNYVLATGPPPEGAAVLRADRLYDPDRLRRALRRGRSPESAVVWQLDGPSGLAGVEDELIRRRHYQPLGRFWALAPARWLARRLCDTPVRPNALTAASGLLVLGASAVVAFGGADQPIRAGVASALALGLVLDTADGHLARLQGTASEFGRWLDAFLDEVGDMVLHAAIAWATFAREQRPLWLGLGLLYAMGKYLFVVATAKLEPEAGRREASWRMGSEGASWPKRLVRLAGHADVRWHLWIILAALGRLDVALAAYAAYFPLRTAAVAAGKVARHA
ncbi:MAG: CDP-alcohol phosphatidyltransferase family protein [Isosphaeraceae bacterium]|nr:CDP-alcohol phosphatidyltransferase family protein [Isosphaeraceae bacterium]